MLSVFYWLRKKKISNIFHFKIQEQEDSAILLNQWEEYYCKNHLENIEDMFLFVDNFDVAQTHTYYQAFRRILEHSPNLRIVVFSEKQYKNVSDLKQYYYVGMISISSLRKEEVPKYFEIYQLEITKEDVEILAPTGYLPGLLKKCVDYYCMDWSLEDAVKECMSNDYPSVIVKSDIGELSKSAEKLAAILSLFEFQFSKRITDAFIKNFGIDTYAKRELLNNKILINNSRYSYYIEACYRQYFLQKLDDDLKKCVCSEIAAYYYTTFSYKKGWKKSSMDVLCGIDACSYLQKAQEYEQAEILLTCKRQNVCLSAMRRGYYEKILSVLENQYQNMKKVNYWIVYEYFHCLIITGKNARIKEMLNTIIIEEIPEYECQIGILRLKCEAIYEQADGKTVLQILDTEYERIKDQTKTYTVDEQMDMLRVQMLIEEKRYEEAEKICRDFIRRVKQEQNKKRFQYNLAVSGTYLLIIQNDINAEIDQELIKTIPKIFESLNDERGMAWIQGIIGEIRLDAGEKGEDDIIESINKRSRIEEKSKAYRVWLNKIKAKTDNLDVIRRIEEEEKRLS